MGFSRQEYWSGWPCPSPGDLPNPGMESAPLNMSLGRQVGSLPLVPPRKPRGEPLVSCSLTVSLKQDRRVPGRAKSQESQLRLPPWGPQSSCTVSSVCRGGFTAQKGISDSTTLGSIGRTNGYLPKFCSKNNNDKIGPGWGGHPLTSRPCRKISTISKKNRKIDFFVPYDHHNACYSKGETACLSILLKNQKGINIAFSWTESSESQPLKTSTMSLIF